MDERLVDKEEVEVPDIPEVLEQILLYCLDHGKNKLLENKEFVPFTALAVKEDLFIETHPGDSTDECFDLARQTVEGVSGATGYALCYDGFLDTDEGDIDAIIAEGGMAGSPEGFAVCYLYEVDEQGNLLFEEEPAYVGHAPNFMSRQIESC